MRDGVMGVVGCLLAIEAASVSMWVGVVCSSLIAICTCFVQCYRLFRDRDKDAGRDEKKCKEEDKKECRTETTETTDSKQG